MSLARFADLDAATQARIESACDFVNNKITEQRRRFYTVLVWSIVGGLFFWMLTRWDIRIPGGIVLVIVIVMMAHAQNEVKKWYKTLVIPRIVEALGNGLQYSRVSSFSADQFRGMDLFRDRLDKFQSEDQITGKLNEVDYALHEVRAIKRERRGKNTVDVVFFKGLIAILEFNKNFEGQTIVVPDKEGKILGGLFGESDSRHDKHRVNLSDAEFENTYTVFATDDQQANYLLTPKLMQLILRARGSMGELRLAFMQNRLYVTVPSDHDRFEISLFARHVSPMQAIGDLADVVRLAEQLIETLDLETRIWTRV